MNRDEQSLQTAICSFMKLQHPNVIFKVDHGANQNKKSHIEREIYKKQQYKRGYPDFQIIKPCGAFNGLFLELKGCSDDLFNKNGTMKRGSEDHHVEQLDFIKKLRANAYWADFCWKFEDAVDIINNYLINKNPVMLDYCFNSLTLSEKNNKLADNFFNEREIS